MNQTRGVPPVREAGAGGQPLRVPRLADDDLPGTRFVRRAVPATLAMLILLMSLAVTVAAMVTIDGGVRASGIVGPADVQAVRAHETALVRDILVHSGATVAAGEPLVQLYEVGIATRIARLAEQRQLTDIELRQMQEALPVAAREVDERARQAAANLQRARAALRQTLADIGWSGSVDSLVSSHRFGEHVRLDLAVSEVATAEAEARLSELQEAGIELRRYDRERLAVRLSHTDAQIREAHAELRLYTLLAPIAGVVSTEDIHRLPGTVVQAGEQLMEIQGVTVWKVDLKIPERHIHRVHGGQPVRIRIAAFDRSQPRHLAGVITHVATQPIDDAPDYYRAIAKLDLDQQQEVAQQLRRGFHVEGRVITHSGRVLSLMLNYLLNKADVPGRNSSPRGAQ